MKMCDENMQGKVIEIQRPPFLALHGFRGSHRSAIGCRRGKDFETLSSKASTAQYFGVLPFVPIVLVDL